MFSFQIIPNSFMKLYLLKEIMKAILRLKTKELNDDFIKSVKKIFKNREIEITVTPANKKKGQRKFVNAIEDIRLRRNIISFSPFEFRKLSRELSTE